jgi:hypothetical protein
VTTQKASSTEIACIYFSGIVQGISLVTFPAASAVFTAPAGPGLQGYGLSTIEYGGMFLPQALAAIASSLLGAGLTRRLGTKTLYLLGLGANLCSMALLAASSFSISNQDTAYHLLLAATAFLGIGFGFTVPSLNTFAAAFFPARVDRAVLVLNALLGIGTALAPVLFTVFSGFLRWWMQPLFVAAILVGLALSAANLPLAGNTETKTDSAESCGGREKGRVEIPRRFWIFAAFALVYGICETMNGNWAGLYMTQTFHAGATQAALALTLFWSSVTGGRILFAVLEKFVPSRIVCRILPLFAAAAFILQWQLPFAAADFGLYTFALAGLGCSALLPLAISFGQQELSGIANSVAAGLIAFYQIGYGIAAFGVGPLQSNLGLSLSGIFGCSAVLALFLGSIARSLAPAGQDIH